MSSISQQIQQYKNPERRKKTSHAWKKLTNGTNLAEPIIASFLGIIANVTCLKVLCHKSKKNFRKSYQAATRKTRPRTLCCADLTYEDGLKKKISNKGRKAKMQ
jgi:hypothetical protein